MSVGMMMRSEYLKTRKRFAFLMTMMFFAGICLIGAIAAWDASRDLFAKTGRHNYQLPEAWGEILGDPAQMSVFFAAILVILLISQEFPWRTARQNVIDGLSRNQWFGSKLLLTVAVCVMFAVLAIVIGVAFALPATPDGAVLIRSIDLHAIGGYLFALAGLASMAFMLSMLIRNPGPALGVFLLWFGFIERVIGLTLHKLSDGKLKGVSNYFPASNFIQMVDAKTWNPAALQAQAAEAVKRGFPAPEPPNIELLLALGAAYIVAFVAISYVTYMKRDL